MNLEDCSERTRSQKEKDIEQALICRFLTRSEKDIHLAPNWLFCAHLGKVSYLA